MIGLGSDKKEKKYDATKKLSPWRARFDYGTGYNNVGSFQIVMLVKKMIFFHI